MISSNNSSLNLTINFLLTYAFCTRCKPKIETILHNRNLYKIRKSTNNWSSNWRNYGSVSYSLICERPRILLTGICDNLEFKIEEFMMHCGEQKYRQEVLIKIVNAAIRVFPRKYFHLYLQQLQLYYYMQKVASGNMGNPKKSMECPICNKVLYDRSTWNRHMRIHTGKKKSRKVSIIILATFI